MNAVYDYALSANEVDCAQVIEMHKGAKVLSISYSNHSKNGHLMLFALTSADCTVYTERYFRCVVTGDAIATPAGVETAYVGHYIYNGVPYHCFELLNYSELLEQNRLKHQR